MNLLLSMAVNFDYLLKILISINFETNPNVIISFYLYFEKSV